MSDFEFPPLLDGFVWCTAERNKKATDFAIIQTTGGNTLAAVTNDSFVEVWKREGGGGWVVAGHAETLQQALNMAAALVALGEADE